MTAVQGFLQKAADVHPRFSQWVAFVICYGGWLLLSFVPVSGHTMVGAGFRYPAYCRASAADFVLRSWAILGLAVFWYRNYLPNAVARLKTIAPFGFTLYVLHWFFIELFFSRIYVDISYPKNGEPSWQAGLVLGLTFCFL